MKYVYPLILIIILFYGSSLKAASLQDSTEVYIIESYVAPEEPQILNLSFFTSEPVKSLLIFENDTEIEISTQFTEDHSAAINLTGIVTSKKKFSCYVLVENEAGNTSRSERLDIELPEEFVAEETGQYLFACITGSIFFLTPSLSYINRDGEPYFGLNKEIPFLSFRGGGFSNNAGYFSFEYQHIFDVPDRNNILRLGYKHIIGLPGIEYVSPGITGFTDLQGYNGLGTEISLGLFKLYNFFTVYVRGRYNFQPGVENSDFSELTIGLHTSFFTFQL